MKRCDVGSSPGRFDVCPVETPPARGVGTVVDTGAWTKDDGGESISTLAPRERPADSGDTLRFAVRGDSLVSADRNSGAEGLTLIRSR